MKIVYTYHFLFIYVSTLLSPIVPVIEYNLNYDYIAKVLCINRDEPELNCNGKCQLAKEIKKTLPIKTQDKLPILPVIDFDKFQVTHHNTEQHQFEVFQLFNKLKFLTNKKCKTNNYITSVFQPPEFLI